MPAMRHPRQAIAISAAPLCTCSKRINISRRIRRRRAFLFSCTPLLKRATCNAESLGSRAQRNPMQVSRASRPQHHFRLRRRQSADAARLLALKGRLLRRQIGGGVESGKEDMDTNNKRFSRIRPLYNHQGKRHCCPPDSQSMSLVAVRVLGWYRCRQLPNGAPTWALFGQRMKNSGGRY